MFFNSYLEFVFIVIFIISFNLLKRLKVSNVVYQLSFLVGNILILSTLLSYSSLFVLSILSVVVYFIGKFIKKQRVNSHDIFLLSIVSLISLFIVRNYSDVQVLFNETNLKYFIDDVNVVQKIGISYILFRYLYFLIDIKNNKIKNIDFVTFYNYIFFFSTFLAGPIDRYQNFSFWQKRNIGLYSNVLISKGLFRILIGVVKKYIIVSQILLYATDYAQFTTVYSTSLSLFISLLFYSAYIYMDFSGYSDIAIGTAYLIGIKTPENFRTPYLSTNLSDFWRRWHITFSNFLGNNVFRPVVKGLSTKYPSSPRLLISIIGYIVTFVLCGIWHGNTWNYVYWGLWHGIGLSLFKIWDIYVNNNYMNYTNYYFVKIKNILGVLITFVFVTIGWFFFHFNTSNSEALVLDIFDKNETELRPQKFKDSGYGIKIINKDYEGKLINIKCEKIGDDEKWIFKDDVYNDYQYLINTKPGLYRIYTKLEGEKLWNRGVVSIPKSNIVKTNIQKEFEILIGIVQNEDTILDYKVDSRIITYYNHWKGYGHGVGVSYVPPNDSMLVDIQYREINENWKFYYENRLTKYTGGQIIGNELAKDGDVTLKKGKYLVRLRYKTKDYISSWYSNGKFVIINNE